MWQLPGKTLCKFSVLCIGLVLNVKVATTLCLRRQFPLYVSLVLYKEGQSVGLILEGEPESLVSAVHDRWVFFLLEVRSINCWSL